ncbi:MAG: OmpA family protein, partial [Flavobacteriaceae bacterium]|nr:OmpA family protein [Flavobacteriaceae bacterium]
ETAKQKSIINEAVTFLKENPNTNAKVVGYADKGTGTVTINNELSRKRASKVIDQLIKGGIAKDRIHSYWRGDDAPQPYAENEKNRVAIITILNEDK